MPTEPSQAASATAARAMIQPRGSSPAPTSAATAVATSAAASPQKRTPSARRCTVADYSRAEAGALECEGYNHPALA